MELEQIIEAILKRYKITDHHNMLRDEIAQAVREWIKQAIKEWKNEKI